jgi:hypothetical protein
VSFAVDKNKLGSASVSSTLEAYITKMSCVRNAYDEFDCDYQSYETVEVTLQATIVGTGNAYPSTSSSQYHFPGGFYRSKSSGTSRDATVSAISLTVGDTPIQFPSNAEKYAYIYKYSNGDFSIYRNGN